MNGWHEGNWKKLRNNLQQEENINDTVYVYREMVLKKTG